MRSRAGSGPRGRGRGPRCAAARAARARTALRRCSGSEPHGECPRATTSSQRPPLRAETTAPPGRPHSEAEDGVDPARRACVANGSERAPSSGTHTSSRRATAACPAASRRAAWVATAIAALHVGDARPDQALALPAQRVARRPCRAGRRCRGGRAAPRAARPAPSSTPCTCRPAARGRARSPGRRTRACRRCRPPARRARRAPGSGSRARPSGRGRRGRDRGQLRQRRGRRAQWRSRQAPAEATAPGCGRAASRSRRRGR